MRSAGVRVRMSAPLAFGLVAKAIAPRSEDDARRPTPNDKKATDVWIAMCVYEPPMRISVPKRYPRKAVSEMLTMAKARTGVAQRSVFASRKTSASPVRKKHVVLMNAIRPGEVVLI